MKSYPEVCRIIIHVGTNDAPKQQSELLTIMSQTTMSLPSIHDQVVHFNSQLLGVLDSAAPIKEKTDGEIHSLVNQCYL